MTNDHLVLGELGGADQRRNFGDGVRREKSNAAGGLGTAAVWRVILEGGAICTLQNQTYYGGDNRTYVLTPGAFPYFHYYDLTVRYSRPWNGVIVGNGEAFRPAPGRLWKLVFAALRVFVRYGGEVRSRDGGANEDDQPQSQDPHGGGGIRRDAQAPMREQGADRRAESGYPSPRRRWPFGPHFRPCSASAAPVSASDDLGVRG